MKLASFSVKKGEIPQISSEMNKMLANPGGLRYNAD